MAPQEMADAVARRGELAYIRKHYQALIATYEQMLLLQPGNSAITHQLADAHYAVGLAALQHDDMLLARHHLRAAVDADPTHSAALAALQHLE